MVDIMELHDSMQRAKRILGRIGYQGKRAFSDEDIEGIISVASFDALEDLALGAPAFNSRDLGWVARNHGDSLEVIKRMFRDYRSKDSRTEIFPLLFRARYAIDFEKYPYSFIDEDEPFEIAA